MSVPFSARVLVDGDDTRGTEHPLPRSIDEAMKTRAISLSNRIVHRWGHCYIREMMGSYKVYSTNLAVAPVLPNGTQGNYHAKEVEVGGAVSPLAHRDTSRLLHYSSSIQKHQPVFETSTLHSKLPMPFEPRQHLLSVQSMRFVLPQSVSATTSTETSPRVSTFASELSRHGRPPSSISHPSITGQPIRT